MPTKKHNANIVGNDALVVLFSINNVEIAKVETEPGEYIEEVVLYKNKGKIRMQILGIFKET